METAFIILAILVLVKIILNLIDKDYDTMWADIAILVLILNIIVLKREIKDLKSNKTNTHESIAKNRIYEYEVTKTDTIPIDTIYTEGMSGKTYYLKH